MAGGPSVTVNNDARDRQFRRLRWFGPERRDRRPRRGRHAPGDWSSNAVARHRSSGQTAPPGRMFHPSATSPWPSTTSRYLALHGFRSAPPRLPTAGRIPILSGLAFWPKPRHALGSFHAAAGACSVIRGWAGSPDGGGSRRAGEVVRVLREDGAGTAPSQKSRSGPDLPGAQVDLQATICLAGRIRPSFSPLRGEEAISSYRRGPAHEAPGHLHLVYTQRAYKLHQGAPPAGFSPRAVGAADSTAATRRLSSRWRRRPSRSSPCRARPARRCVRPRAR